MDRFISEQAVIDTINEWLNSDGDTHLLEQIKAIPSAEPKTGHWINLDDKSAICSCCYKNNTLYGYFCKWCGAKMVEPQEISDRNLKMWEDIYAEEKRRKENNRTMKRKN